MRMELPAELASVEEFFVEFHRRSHALMDRANCFAAELLVREALTNAVVHGCGEDPTKSVLCWLRLRGDRLLIAVADGGEGFDWRIARHKLTEHAGSSGRGVGILYRYSDHVRYSDKGNVVTMLKRIERG
jgi:anti-sigma regulatory factor (Ser/Thr protein kinase)